MNSQSQNWKRPDELIKLHRLKQKKKQLAARFNNNNNRIEISDNDKAQLLEAKIAQKRKNPFAKTGDNVKKSKTEEPAVEEDSLLGFISTPTTAAPLEVMIRETPTRPPPAKLAFKPFDAKEFSKLLHQNSAAADEDESSLEQQNITKHLPMDWSIKTRVRFFCRSELPATNLKTSQRASGLTSCVRCINTSCENSSGGLDISPATRFNQSTYYFQHPHLPWMTLFPRNSRENIGITFGEKEKKALAEDWDYSFGGLFQLLRARQCPYFYLCANTFTVLFRAAGTGGRVETHALLTPSTRGIRSALRQEGIEFSMPLKKNAALNKSGQAATNDSMSEESNSLGLENAGDSSELGCNEDNLKDVDQEEDDDENWLESLGVDKKEILRIQTAHTRKLKVQEMAEDFSDNSLLLIEGVECQGLYSFLLNAKSTISNVGRLAGIPPTLLSPVAFPKATMQHIATRSNEVRMDGVNYHSIEVKGIILPTFLPYVCQLLGESKQTFSATLASSNNTLAFSKATQILQETPKQNEQDEEEKPTESEEATAGQVFGQENLSDCGLLPNVIENICQTGPHAVALLERVCYDKEFGYAWS